MRYVNPVLFADCSDPDVICVDGIFYMTVSSFTCLPGLPVFRSPDLVQWELIGHAAPSLPFPRYSAPAHGRGIWAPSLRFHDGRFMIYACLPDEGLLAFTAEDPSGPWETHIVREVTGWIDPCPFWDAEGRAWLVHAFAGSRAGIKNILYLHAMSPDGLSVTDEGRMIYAGYEHGDTTVEGPKMYVRDGHFLLLCPAGGVTSGYQLALLSPSPYGPYARRVILAQGDTPVNGPHQGALVTGPDGKSWFLHFQDRGPYGRVLHLQPVTWDGPWPVAGDRAQPVPCGETPYTGGVSRPVSMSDALRGPLSLKWQFQANPDRRWFLEGRRGLTLFAIPAPTLFEAGQFLSQTLRFRDFDLSVAVRPLLHPGGRAGLGVMGYTYAFLAIEGTQLVLVRGEARSPSLRMKEDVREETVESYPLPPDPLVLTARVRNGSVRFGWRTGGKEYLTCAGFPLACGGWTGARIGIFCLSAGSRAAGKAVFSRLTVLEHRENSAEGSETDERD